jgi:hypothetical protein
MTRPTSWPATATHPNAAGHRRIADAVKTVVSGR